MNKAVEAENLTKLFGNTKALDEMSFTVEAGEVYGLIGPNGAGKTTTLRIVSTLILPTTGTATVFNLNVVEDAAKIREIITYLPEEAGAYKNLSGREYLEFMARFVAHSKDDMKIMVNDAGEISGLGSRLNDRVKTYSKGMKRRLLVARALMTKPKLAVLDEPTSGLDVLHSYHVRGLIKEYVKKHGVTVLLSSHNMLEVEFLCDKVALVNKGRIIAEGTPEELKTENKVSNLEEAFAKVVGLA